MRNRKVLIFSNPVTFYGGMFNRVAALDTGRTFAEQDTATQDTATTVFSKKVFNDCMKLLLKLGFTPSELQTFSEVDRRTRTYFVEQFATLIFRSIYFNRKQDLDHSIANEAKAILDKCNDEVAVYERRTERGRRYIALPMVTAPAVLTLFFLVFYLVGKYSPTQKRFDSFDEMQIGLAVEMSAGMLAVGVFLTAAIVGPCLYMLYKANAQKNQHEANPKSFDAELNAWEPAGDYLPDDEEQWKSYFDQLITGETLFNEALDRMYPVEGDVETPREREMNECTSLITNRR